MIKLQNKHFTLEIADNATAKSLIFNKTGEELLYLDEPTPIFSFTEERPFNNEIKLAYPNRETTFNANRISIDGDILTVGFELVPLEAKIRVKTTDEYISFELCEVPFNPNWFFELCMSETPVYKFRLLQLPVKERGRFGELLNVEMDDRLAVNVLANCPEAIVSADKRYGFKILTAECHRDIKLYGVSASLIVNETDKLLDSIDVLEEDYDLPRGVKSRRSPELNGTMLSVSGVTKDNVDEFIDFAKRGGFTMMKLCIFNLSDLTYDNFSSFKGGEDELKYVLDKLRAAGIHPGMHVLHTYIGTDSKHVSPNVDHRLNLARMFTLAKPLGVDDTTVYVEENPRGCTMHEQCRILNFGGEAINYTSYTTERPYKFEGCTRGYLNSRVREHELGQIGGLLDISEFGGGSIYINQKSTLQDEIAEKIAHIYGLGFEFMYFDGAEGTNPPFAYYVPLAQYRVYKKLKNPPLFCEGAARAHFSWHMISGGNAFDIFPAKVFKENIARHPLAETKLSANDFTQIDFGWWMYDDTYHVDHYEYGVSKSVACNCPASLIVFTEPHLITNPRNDDIVRMFKRWADVRHNNLLTDEEKEKIKNPDKEFTLLINESGEYELCEYEKINGTPDSLSAYVFSKNGLNYVVYWSTAGEESYKLCLDGDKIEIKDEYAGNSVEFKKENDGVVIVASDKKYLSSNISKEELARAFAEAVLIGGKSGAAEAAKVDRWFAVK